MVIYVTLSKWQNSEHFVGITQVSKIIGIQLNAVNILCAFVSYFEVYIRNGRFFMMDTMNVNSCELTSLNTATKTPSPNGVLNWLWKSSSRIML